MSESPIRDPESAEAAAVPITHPPITPLLSAAQRKALRAKAHELDPIVRIGDAGLSDAVIRETDLALTAHGLIKVRVFGDDREARETIGATMCERLGCALVQSIGKLLVLWREQPESALKKTPIRRRTESAPKKLAAEGKSGSRKRTRPGVPKPEQIERIERGLESKASGAASKAQKAIDNLQAEINEFGKLNGKKKELQSDLAEVERVGMREVRQVPQ
jgi:putative YhbY family RNA-binding protein